MVHAWYLDSETAVSLTSLSRLCISYCWFEADRVEDNDSFETLCQRRGYDTSNNIEFASSMGGSMKDYFQEHLRDHNESIFAMQGSGFFDVREPETDRWIRIRVDANDFIVLPAGMFFRFAANGKQVLRARRFSPSDAGRVVHPRCEFSEQCDVHRRFLLSVKDVGSDGANGRSLVLGTRAQAYANYPHARIVNGFIHVSGTSCRRPDNTHVGVERHKDGTLSFSIEEQTRAVIENIRWILQQSGADLQHLVAVTVYLIDFDDFAGFNAVYNQYFDADNGPTRTTLAVKRLPHPNLRIEIQSVAVDPAANDTTSMSRT